MRLVRFFLFVLLLTSAAAVANAYTLVLRDGRRVEIPNEFNVKDSMLTYEVGNGLQVTLQLSNIDVSATERANGEAPGSFLNKANAPKAPVQSIPAPQVLGATARRSITNADLEKYRRARIRSEKERKDLGLPSLEERRAEIAAIEDRMMEQVRKMQEQEEAYWRSRADALQAQLAANQATIEALRQRPLEMPYSYSYGAYPALWPVDTVGFGITRGPFNGFRRSQTSPFSGFLATPITPFPVFETQSRRPVFVSPGVRGNSRPFHRRR
jgi:hypothetical protein